MLSLFHRLRPHHCVLLTAAFGIASGCVANGANDGGAAIPIKDAGVGGGTIVNVFDGGRFDAQTVRDAEVGLDPRCGAADYCDHGTPDRANACDDHFGDSGAPVRRREAGVHHSSDASVASRDASVVLDGGDGGDASRSSIARKEHDGGVHVRSLPIPEPLPPPPDAGAQHYSCQVARDNSGSPVRQCLPSGDRAAAQPCASASQCAPGFACVGATNLDLGICLHYCCEPGWACDPGTFCAERPLLDDGSGKKPLVVPVCAPAENCALLEPFPCTGPSCTCTDPTTTCTIVRPDGTRGCVTPGTGKVNDRCDRSDLACAPGYYCSLATSLCVKMCKTNGMDPRCAPGKCQAAAGFPAGFGLCVGYTPSTQ